MGSFVSAVEATTSRSSFNARTPRPGRRRGVVVGASPAKRRGRPKKAAANPAKRRGRPRKTQTAGASG
jgi:hypothetical protein